MKQLYQPITTVDGVNRFVSNALVRHLLEAAKSGRTCGMNELFEVPCSIEDRRQFAQLIGYSLSGYGELPYVDDEEYRTVYHLRDNPEVHPAEAKLVCIEEKLKSVKNALAEGVAELYEIAIEDLQVED